MNKRVAWILPAAMMMPFCCVAAPSVDAVAWGTQAGMAHAAYDEALGFLGKGRQKDAEALAAEACTAYPDSQRLLFLRGVLERSRFSKPASRQSFSAAYALGADTVPGQAVAAVVTMDMGLMVDGGFESLRGLISGHPDEILIRWLFAIECREHRKYAEEAAEQYEVMLEEWPVGPVLVLQTYANILTEALGRPEDALEHRMLAAELEPTTWTYQGAANTLKALERYEEANEVYAKLLELDPKDSNHWTQWGSCLFEMGDYAAAAEKFEQAYACNRTDVASLLFWGRSLEKQGRQGEGFSKYAQAVEQDPGHQYASIYAALSKLYGYGTKPDYDWAAELARAVNPKTALFPDMNLKFCVQISEKDDLPLVPERTDVLLAHLLDLAERGNPAAQFNLGKIHAEGIGVAADGILAVEWLEKALAAGKAASAIELARLYKRGKGQLKKDAGKAFEYYRLAAEYGNSDAMNETGRRYLVGDGVEPSLKMAVQWLDRCGEQKGSLSHPYRLLGAAYKEGTHGAPKDWIEAARWYQKGSDLGDATCERILGNMYEQGGDEYFQDVGKAMEYYRRVWERGYHNGARALIDLYCKCDDPGYRDTGKAIELGLDIVVKNPKNPVCLEALAMAYAYDGQFDKAVQFQQQAIDLESANPFSRSNRATNPKLELYRQGRVE
jgi:TPR repeat protein